LLFHCFKWRRYINKEWLYKLMLNIWKVLDVTFGDLTTDYDCLKHNIREASGLPMNDKCKFPPFYIIIPIIILTR
jgi:hypothetical protein